MAVPKKRLTSARSGSRRSQLLLKKTKLSKCPQCKEPILPHRACPNCGYYRGRLIIDLDKKERKKKEKAQKEGEEKNE